eukprot:5128153-Amphidinium_carterae.1
MILFRLAGFRLAYHKAEEGVEVTWIGARFTFGTDSVVVTVKPQMLTDIHDYCTKFLASDLISVKDLRRFC